MYHRKSKFGKDGVRHYVSKRGNPYTVVYSGDGSGGSRGGGCLPVLVCGLLFGTLIVSAGVKLTHPAG